MTDAPITISAAEYARLRAAVDRLDRRPTATTEPAVCHCRTQRSCHVGHKHRGLLPDAPLPPGVVQIEMED